MIIVFLIFLILTTAIYIYYSRVIGNFINGFTIPTVFKIVIDFILEPITYTLNLFEYDVWTFLYIYLASFLMYAGTLVGAMKYMRIKPSNIHKKNIPIHAIPWMLLLVGYIVYIPIIVEYRDYLLDPQYIYEQTRSGYGPLFFGSALIVNCALIVFLFTDRKHHIVFFIAIIIFALLRGQKALFITYAAIYIIWALYLKGIRFRFFKAFSLIIIMLTIFTGIFVLNYRGEITSLFLVVSGYSDYNRNASLIVDDKVMEPFYGKILFEHVLISKIPRILWRDKPKNFGEFRFSEKYFSDSFEMDQGTPSFGIGTLFADFNLIAIPISLIMGLFSGYIYRYFSTKLEKNPNVYNFTMTVFATGTSLLPVGGYYIVEHIIIGVTLYYSVRLLSYMRHINRNAVY